MVITHLSSLPKHPRETATKSVAVETYLEVEAIGFRWWQDDSHVWHLRTQAFAWD